MRYGQRSYRPRVPMVKATPEAVKAVQKVAATYGEPAYAAMRAVLKRHAEGYKLQQEIAEGERKLEELRRKALAPSKKKRVAG